MDGSAREEAGARAPTPQAYRDGMAAIAGHVTIVTTSGPAGTSGFTASAVVSVSDDPPTLLVCLNRKSQNGPLIEANGRFTVNALGAGDETLAEVFAGRAGLSGAERFGTGDWILTPDAPPALSAALARFSCRLIEAKPVATHVILIGRVERVDLGEARPALAYFRRGYRLVAG